MTRKNTKKADKQKDVKKAADAAPVLPPVEACACAVVGDQERPAGATCTICNGVIPEPAAPLPPQLSGEMHLDHPMEQCVERQCVVVAPDELLDPDGQAGADVKKADVAYPVSVADSRKSLEQLPPVGMKFFESPEGYIEIGDAHKSRVFCRHINGGKGGWINAKR